MPRGREPRATRRDDRSQARQHRSCPWSPQPTATSHTLFPAARFTDLGPGYYQARLDTDRKLKNHIRQIQALGFEVTITKAA